MSVETPGSLLSHSGLLPSLVVFFEGDSPALIPSEINSKCFGFADHLKLAVEHCQNMLSCKVQFLPLTPKFIPLIPGMKAFETDFDLSEIVG